MKLIFLINLFCLSAFAGLTKEDAREFLLEKVPNAAQMSAFTIIGLSDASVKYEGYSRAEVCIEESPMDPDDHGYTECLKSEVRWTPALTVSMNSMVYWGFGDRIDREQNYSVKANLALCIKNLSEVIVVGESMPTAAPAKMIISSQCEKYLNPLLDAGNTDSNASGAKFSSLISLKINMAKDLVISNGALERKDAVQLAQQLLSSSQVSEIYVRQSLGHKFDAKANTSLSLLPNYWY